MQMKRIEKKLEEKTLDTRIENKGVPDGWCWALKGESKEVQNINVLVLISNKAEFRKWKRLKRLNAAQ